MTNYNYFIDYDEGSNLYIIVCLEFLYLKYTSNSIEDCIEELNLLVYKEIDLIKKNKDTLPKKLKRHEFPNWTESYIFVDDNIKILEQKIEEKMNAWDW